MKHLPLLILLLTLLAPSGGAKAQSEHNFEVVKQLDIFNTIYKELDLYYVDTLRAKEHIDNAIIAMLRKIDPYTVYYPEEETDKLRQMTTGKYAGIGAVISYNEKEDRCMIAEPIEDMPAAKVGLRPGDVILSIDGKDVPPCAATPKNEYSTMVSGRLRGEPGTTFELRVRRPGTHRTLTFRITRRNIVEPSVSVEAVLPDSIGYLHLSQFIVGTADEVRRTIIELKQQGARRLIVDLRGNPGGLLDEAVKVVNFFIPRGREVLSTKGKVREANHTYKTTLDPLDPHIPLVILTDFGSASSAEITAGALQDYDRALIVGRRTYGKGLVQQSRELPYKAQLKLTTGHYFIPSGRCVQAYEFKDGEPVHLPDSLCKRFFTANGRVVRDGGGITPDIEVKGDSLPNLIAYLATSDRLFDYVVDYRNRHPRIAPPETFSLTADEYADFIKFMKAGNFTYDRLSLKSLEKVKELAAFEGYADEAKAEFAALEAKLSNNLDNDFRRWEKEIRQVVESAILTNYYYSRGAARYLLKSDTDLREAVRLLNNPKLYKKILSGEPDA